MHAFSVLFCWRNRFSLAQNENLVDDIAARYAPMIAQLAEIYAAHEAAHAQLGSLKVTREEWDDNMRGGHFWFDVSGSPGVDDDFLVDALALDVDGALIDVIIHPVGGLLNWGEWYRLPLSLEDLETPIKRWPPPSVSPHRDVPPGKSPKR